MICQVKDLSIYYEVHGDGVPILMLHGTSVDHHLMKGCLEPLFARQSGWKRIYLDLPGMGRTPGGDWVNCADQLLEVLLEFVEQVIPRQSFLLVGESYGAYLARGIIQQKPERIAGLCLICPVSIADPRKRTVPPAITLVHDEALLAGLSESEAAAFTPMAVVHSPRTWCRFRDEILIGLNVANVKFIERLQTTGYEFSFPVDSRESPFEKPALFLMGRQDAAVGYRDAWDILECYPRATFAILDVAGHNLQIEQERLFEELVGEWLERVKTDSRSGYGLPTKHG